MSTRIDGSTRIGELKGKGRSPKKSSKKAGGDLADALRIVHSVAEDLGGGGRLVGDVSIIEIDSLKPNSWNPNKMSDFERRSLGEGLDRDGWLKSQVLLVWGTDSKGKSRNIIIDGEQRWTVAKEKGFTHCPVVLLHGLTEREAKELTLKFIYRRGKPDAEKVSEVIKGLDLTNLDEAALRTGITAKELKKLSNTTSAGFLDGLAGDDRPSARSKGQTLTFSFEREQDRELVTRVLDGLGKKDRPTALLALCERASES